MYVGLYLLPLRHPVSVARQLATIAQLAPGRLTLGVGIGGEDRHEIEVCGVDPKTRGRRMDECLQILRGLADGEPVTFVGEFFSLKRRADRARAISADTADRRRTIGRGGQPRRAGSATAGSGSGSPHAGSRACAIRSPGRPARPAGTPARFEHGLNVWCGFAPRAKSAHDLLAAQMQAFYQMPFEPFERYSPLRHAAAGRRVPERLHRGRLLSFQRDPLRHRRRERDRRGRRAATAADRRTFRTCAQLSSRRPAGYPEQPMSAVTRHAIVIERRECAVRAGWGPRLY